MNTAEKEVTYDKISSVLNHIENVQRNCYRLGLTLIKKGDVEMGRILIANGQVHDNSKFKGIEFDHLFNGSPLLKDVVRHHATTNPHHPEYWGNIHCMPDVYLAEMACDCAARSAEFGSDLRKWITETATHKYVFDIDGRVGQTLMKFVDLLLTPAFK